MDKNHLEINELAKQLWSYNILSHDLRLADFIFVMCSYNLSVADRAYDLFQQKLGKFILLSGGIAHQNDLLNTGWDKPEAVIFYDRLLNLGMNPEHIIMEDKATNCGENVIFSRNLLEQYNITPQSGIIVQKPYMERRALATAQKQWSNIQWQVTSPVIAYDDYIIENDEEKLINILVGDTQRIIDYADKGFQIAQHMPKNILDALTGLKKYGYTKHL